MSEIVVCGGSVIGLASAMILARDGPNVTVLEHDAGEVPGSANEAWAPTRGNRGEDAAGGLRRLRSPHESLLPCAL